MGRLGGFLGQEVGDDLLHGIGAAGFRILDRVGEGGADGG